MNSLLKILGAILLTIGLFLALRPDLFGKFPSSIDAYQMIEKRVKWGFLIGFGLFLIFNNYWIQWGLITTTLFITLICGFIIARLLGFILDGFFSKQLWWLVIELVALLLFGFLYYGLKH